MEMKMEYFYKIIELIRKFWSKLILKKFRKIWLKIKVKFYQL